MAIYTGNQGRMYMARAATSGLTGTFTVPVNNGIEIRVNQTFQVYTSRGNGVGAVVKANTNLAANASSRTISFSVQTAGAGYLAGDAIYFARTSGSTVVTVVNAFTLNSAQTLGVDNESEIIQDIYRIAKIRDWSYNSNSEVVEATALGDVTKTFLPSITSGEGSATLMFYENDSTANNNTKDIYELIDILFPRSTPPRVFMSLMVDAKSSAGAYLNNFMFAAYITSASISNSYGEVVAVSTNFTVDGPLLDAPSRPNAVNL